MTLLGIVFFFVLAVNRGWIGPVTRVTLGALASVFLLSAGLYVKRRFEDMYHSAVAAVGAGIAGGYITLVAAKVLYGLVPDWAAAGCRYRATLVLARGRPAVGSRELSVHVDGCSARASRQGRRYVRYLSDRWLRRPSRRAVCG